MPEHIELIDGCWYRLVISLEEGHIRGKAFFLRKEYCVTAHHILDSFEEIHVDINNKRIPAIYDRNCSDK
jgi:hypothetical protein